MTTDSHDATGAPLAAPANGRTPAARDDVPNARGRRASDRMPAEAGSGASRGFAGWLVGGLALLILAAALGTWFVQDRLMRVERDLARRLQSIEVQAQQREPQVKALGDTVREAQAKVALLEAKLAESLGQQAQLRQLYDQMARGRGDLMLADVESSVSIAVQQLQLAGNVSAALLAMQEAERALAQSNQPDLIGLRRIVSRDIERLKAVPLVDFTAAVNRLDAVLGVIDQMPLLADLKPAVPGAGGAPSTAPEPREGWRGAFDRLSAIGDKGWEAFLAELRGVFRVQRVDQSEALLLSADQRFVAREVLRLQLLNARLNLLARNEPLFRSDLARAGAAIERGFDGTHRAVASAQSTLRQLQTLSLAGELPSLNESLQAVRTARSAPDGSETR
jgi:uroporphyrin-3 C-methyltransferase